MSQPEVREPRPSARARLTEEGLVTTNLQPSLTPLTGPLDGIAAHIDGAFVLVVRVTGGRYRRRCFLSAASAERAARNAQEAGHNAEVFLAELRPLRQLEGGRWPRD